MIRKLTAIFPQNASTSSPPITPPVYESPLVTLKPEQAPKPVETALSPSRTHPGASSKHRSEQSWFGMLPVSSALRHALEDMEYTVPTAVQEEVIPLVREGRDVVGQAQTGTGKTAAFGIPLVEAITPDVREPQALVLVPTRELAVQVRDELSRLGQFCGVHVVAIYGGQAISLQLEALHRGADIVVATPGRLMDHMKRGSVNIGHVHSVVLDEADQMLDIGFAPDIDRILRRTPLSRQTLLFSATIPGPINRLARRYLNDPAWILIGGEAEPVEQVKQHYYEVAALDRPNALDELLRQPGIIIRALVFLRTRVGVDMLVTNLQGRGHDAQAIHGDMPQFHRDRVMSRFRSGGLRVLVATNIAARGLDIPGVSHVINYDMPGNLEEYVHRIGRTARMGRPGTAITFVSEWDFPILDVIQDHIGSDLERRELAFSHT